MFKRILMKIPLIIYWPCIGQKMCLSFHLRLTSNSLTEFSLYGASVRNVIYQYPFNCFLRFLAWHLSRGTFSNWKIIWTWKSSIEWFVSSMNWVFLFFYLLNLSVRWVFILRNLIRAVAQRSMIYEILKCTYVWYIGAFVHW